MPTRREQFRIRGPLKTLNSAYSPPLREALWRALSPATRATFLWPPPGTPLMSDPNVFVREVDASIGVAPAFEILVLEPDRMEWLDLKPHPHDRRRWGTQDDWAELGEMTVER